jgi:hypothetical protein
MQHKVAEYNSERETAKQYKPDFKEGDMLYVWERAAKESRLHADIRNAGGPTPKRARQAVPTKLQYQWQGPFKMLRWQGERYCVILRGEKECSYNVNRLQKQRFWDDSHPDTMWALAPTIPLRELRAESKLSDEKMQLKAGMLIVFPMYMTELHTLPFGVGCATNVGNPREICFQWWGNAACQAGGTFAPCWFQKNEAKYYYKRSRLHPSHTAYSSTDDDTVIGLDDILVFGYPQNNLDANHRLNAATRRLSQDSPCPLRALATP